MKNKHWNKNTSLFYYKNQLFKSWEENIVNFFSRTNTWQTTLNSRKYFFCIYSKKQTKNPFNCTQGANYRLMIDLGCNCHSGPWVEKKFVDPLNWSMSIIRCASCNNYIILFYWKKGEWARFSVIFLRMILDSIQQCNFFFIGEE